MWVEKHGKTYRIRDRVGGTVVTLEAGYPNKTVAKNAMTGLRADELRGGGLIAGGGRILVNDWLDEWQPSWEAALKPSSLKSESARIRNHVRPLLGNHRLDELNDFVIRQWIGKLIKGDGDMGASTRPRRPLGAKTIFNVHGVAYSMGAAAVAAKLIAVNPFQDTSKYVPEIVRREMRYLTEPEFERLLKALPAHWRPLVLLLAMTGLRWGEGIGLRVKNVDVLARPARVTVVEQLQELADTGELIYVDPKTKASRRTVSIIAMVAAALIPLVSGKERNDAVFLAPQGGLVRVRNFRRVWLTSCKRAGLEGLRVHDLRHSHASWLISKGKPLTAIQRRLGHTSIAITSDLYGHLLPGVDEGILDALMEVVDGIDLESMGAELRAELAGELVDL